MTKRVVALFTLKSDISVDDYARWSAERVRPVMRAMPSVLRFDDFRVVGNMDGEALDAQLSELIEVTDFAEFEADNARGEGGVLAKEWRQRLVSWSVLYMEDLLED
ncbi:hypothetical protein [Microbacterium soli]|uniref:REDY-like protein HapK n=1 Tax=Microbacterium soli TaxID=446075 RepID=A0ABP7N4L0_9MICO